jgi:hypothetical protein
MKDYIMTYPADFFALVCIVCFTVYKTVELFKAKETYPIEYDKE